MPYTGSGTSSGPGDDYHLQVFALDAALPAEAASSDETLSQAMRVHVLASGEIVGRGIVDPDLQPRTPQRAPAQ
jgi:phosphatidylethanolamine-binding protein (PEBP) family uncharacterized protein